MRYSYQVLFDKCSQFHVYEFFCSVLQLICFYSKFMAIILEYNPKKRQ